MPSSPTSLAQALEWIQSERVGDRKAGLEEMKRLFRLYQNSPEISKVKDNSFHALFESLFRTVTREKATYSKSSKLRQQETTESRLNSCADALRCAIDASLPRLRLKTLNALVGHFLQTLPSTDGMFFEPLADSYPKSLLTVLKYTPHIEAIPHSTWLNLVDLLLDGLQSLISEFSKTNGTSRGSFHTGPDSLSSRFSQQRGSKSGSYTSRTSVLFQCLKCLVSARNHPLADRGADVLKLSITYLNKIMSTSDALDVIMVLGVCVERLAFESTRLVQKHILEILSIISARWRLKTPELRDEMLKILIYLEPYLLNLASKANKADSSSYVDDLFNEFCEDYIHSESRPRRHHLTLEDLSLGVLYQDPKQCQPMQTPIMSLRKSTSETEHNWTVVYLIAMLLWCSDRVRTDKESGKRPETPTTPKKRRKLGTGLDEVMRKATNASELAGIRVRSLQVMALLTNTRNISEDSLEKILTHLLPLVSSTSNVIASWAIVAIAGCATQPTPLSSELREQWSKIWSANLRSISSAQQSRAACHLLCVMLRSCLVEQNELADCLDMLTSGGGVNHPAVLCDSSLAFWTAFQQSLILNKPGGSAVRCHNEMIRWVVNKWTPSNFESRAYALQCSQTLPTHALLRSMYPQEDNTTEPAMNFSNLNMLGQAWLDLHHHSSIMKYLLIHDEGVAPGWLEVNTRQKGNRVNASFNAQSPESRNTVVAMVLSELDKSIETWSLDTDSRLKNLSPESFQLCFSLTLVGDCISRHSMTKSTTASCITEKLSILRDLYLQYLNFETRRGAINLVVESLMPLLLRGIPIHSEETFSKLLLPSRGLLDQIFHIISQKHSASEELQEQYSMDVDEMDLEVRTGAYHKWHDVPSAILGIRRDLDLSSNTSTFLVRARSCIAYICACYDAVSERVLLEIPRSFVDHLTSLPPSEFLCSYFVLTIADESEQNLSYDDTERLLVHVAQTAMPNYDYRRCEILVCAVTRLLGATVQNWIDDQNATLANVGAQMYEWLIQQAEAGVCSSTSQARFSDLLFTLLQSKHDYNALSKTPSVRTIILNLLKQGTVNVQYYIAHKLPDLFSIYISNQHDRVFEDVMKSLSTDQDWIEGLAVRLLAFAVLASQWSSLRRICVYRIFETAASAINTVPFATYCIKYISEKMGFASPNQLFSLFRSQILYTWLDNNNITSVPWSIFGFVGFDDLTHDSQDEVVAQIMMKGNQDRINEMKVISGSSMKEMLSRAFSKAAAFALLKDLSGPGGRTSHDAENRIIDILDRREFINLLTTNSSGILGHIFTSIENEQAAQEAFQKRKGYDNPIKAWKQLQSIGGADETLPDAQQPSFRIRASLDAIERLCRRTAVDPSKIWTPASVSRILRHLIENIRPALGFIHTRRTMRRIRILVALAGDVALRGYPLERSLHSLRRYLTENHTARDTIALYKYLLDNGREYLSGVPSFVTGTLLLIYLGMRGLLQSTQDSTTQESQHLAMLSDVQKFREWLNEWAEQYVSPKLSSTTLKSFYSLMRTAKGITGAGSSSVNNVNESKLLRFLFDDMRSRKSLLTPRFAELCLRQLCNGFQPAESFHEDFCGTDDQAVTVCKPVWMTARWVGLDDGYRLWTSRVLGRTLRYEGSIPHELTRETTLTTLKALGKSSSDLSSSKTAIVQHFVVNLQSEEPADVIIAEDTLQRMLIGVGNDDESVDIEKIIPDPVIMALRSRLQGEKEAISGLQKEHMPLDDALVGSLERPIETWSKEVNLALLSEARNDVVLNSIVHSIKHSKGDISLKLFPFILHCALETAIQAGSSISQDLSESVKQCLNCFMQSRVGHFQLLINSVIYLLSQKFPEEATRMDRCRWLDVSIQQLAETATACKMYKAALYLVELAQANDSQAPRRRSAKQSQPPNELLLSIFQEVEEPDAFHGVAQNPDLNSVADRLAFEGKGSQEILIRGAESDSQMRLHGNGHQAAFTGVLNSLARLNMSSIAYSLGMSNVLGTTDGSVTDSVTKAAMKLRQWDLTIAGSSESSISSTYQTYQAIHDAGKYLTVRNCLRQGSLQLLDRLEQPENSYHSLRSSFAGLVSLTDAEELFSIRSETELADLLSRTQLGQGWVDEARLDDLEAVLASRETLMGIVSDNLDLQRLLGINRKATLLAEAKVNLQSSQLLRAVGSYQQALNNVTYLSGINSTCKEAGVNIEGAVKQELANVLWDQGELVPSINVLKELSASQDLESQAIPVGKADLLATLGHRVSEARMERPEEILNKYLVKAQKALNRQRKGKEAGRAFHEYAAYCHAQLTNNDFMHEFRRTQEFKDKRWAEVQELENLIKSNVSDEQKARAKHDRSKARKWFEIDRKEFERLSNSREEFLRQSLENYILALGASDEHDTDVLRFVTLWLEHALSTTANEAVANNIREVPMHKFAPLMSQLASRLQNEDDLFQNTMSRLVEMICIEHPYHGIYHIYAGCNTKGGNDPTANSRNAAAKQVAARLQSNQETSDIWANLHRANDLYIKLAGVRIEALKAGMRIALSKVSASKYVARDVPSLSVPPITLSISPRPDRDYSRVPVVTGFKPEMSIASGLSAPKIITAVTSDGTQCKQLFKAGSDDLRQDAIMEQVFEVVSSLLQTNRLTRQRKLNIRTYKVIPLDATSGAIEFVQNTLPLNDFLRGAHPKYHPKDLKWDLCRARVDEARQRSLDSRVRVYKEMTDKFHPVLRHFFFERFEDPDEWFYRRLAYARSTASISILGHALGLGDRHCQNILLDTVTGEVIHIDLGVAFEAGRVLAIPEVVPFRLTRDIVDGMGIMGVEGVFRRCCEFTLEALRNNRDAVMTLLNVLRYDPLYSWSMSPLRAKRLRAEQEEKEASDLQGTKSTARSDNHGQLIRREKSRGDDFSEPERDGGEADRALSVVEKKLAPGLSVMATVNELIQQATDERNLAVLFCGWAAFA